MTSSSTRALRRAALLVLSLGVVRAVVERARAPALMEVADSASSRDRCRLLEESSERRDERGRGSRPLPRAAPPEPHLPPGAHPQR